MITVNMIVEWLETDIDSPLKERVLWIDPCGDAVYVIDINNATSLPILRTRLEIETALNDETAIRLAIDPFTRLVAPVNVPIKHLEVRDRSWEKISRLVTQEPQIYLEEWRKRLILCDPIASQASLDLVYGYLRKFWKRGMSKNALLPDYGNCGAPGKERGIKGGRKRGRKPKVILIAPEMVGVNVDDDIRRIFNIAFKRYYESKERSSLKRAFERMIANHFNLGRVLQGNIEIPIMPEAHMVPTLGQFTYWYHQQRNLVHSIVSREGRRAYVLRHRPVLGSSTKSAFGPGSIYQIDATIADIYLVSQIDRSRIIGRPVLYFCMDVFSRLCVGLHVALEGPSWLTGMVALANATCDKVSFCAELGITIPEEDWPSRFLPEQINADRGEFINISSDQLVDNLNITFANCPPFRGDLKGIVERSFRRANDTFIKWVPGAVRKRELGEPDYRLDATLTLHEFTKTLVLMIIEYNLYHRLDKYPLDREMMGDDVDPVPIDLWNWGIVNRTGHLRERAPDTVKLALLPRDTATVTLRGIRFKGMYYGCELAIREQWFVKARHSGTWTIEASYDPRKPEIIYLNTGSGNLESCQLLSSNEQFKDLPIEEILDYQENQKQKASLHRSVRMQSQGELSAIIEATVDEALKRTEEAKSQQNASKSSRTKGIRDNRQAEKNLQRNNEAWDLRQKPSEESHSRGTISVLPVGNPSGADSLTATKRKSFLEAIERSEQRDDQA